MYVFHDRRFVALERIDDASAVAIERLVECTAFASEPEWMADVLGLTTLGRWLSECPNVAGLRRTRKLLRTEVLNLSNSAPQPWGQLNAALAANRSFDAVLDSIRLHIQRASGAALINSVAASDLPSIVVHAEQLASHWVSSLIHPVTIFKKLVGYVLDPDQKQPASTVRERLANIIDDFAARVPQPHTVSTVVDLGLSKRRRPAPSIRDVEVTAADPENRKFVLQTSVHAPDPTAAASRARLKFLEVVLAWRSGAPGLQVQVPPALQVLMPNGETVSIETRTFRVSPLRTDMAPAWANVQNEDARFLSAGEAMTRAREEASEGRTAQAISTLWSSAEALLRREAELTVAAVDLEARLSTPFLVYFPARQFAILGVHLDKSRATKPRTRSPVNTETIARELVAGQLQSRILGQRAFLRHRITELVQLVSEANALRTRLSEVERKIHRVLFAARIIRNVYVHSRVRVALDFEELYVYKWLDTLFDVFLNGALGLSRGAGFEFDGYLASLPSRMASFERRVVAGPPYDWIIV